MAEVLPFTHRLHSVLKLLGKVVERLSRRLVAPRQKVRVEFQRCRFVRVSQAICERLEVNAVRQAPRGVRMAQRVEHVRPRHARTVASAAESL